MTIIEKVPRVIRSATAVAAGAIGVAAFATLCFSEAVADRSNAPDAAKYSIKAPDGLKVPGGLAFAEGDGYEDWAVIASHHTDDLVGAIVGNPLAMEAFRAGVPANGKPVPRWLQDRKDPMELEEEPRLAPLRQGAGRHDCPRIHGERCQEVPGQWRMGICDIQA
jgi:hypothetical protein